jgi:hypothetical protein
MRAVHTLLAKPRPAAVTSAFPELQRLLDRKMFVLARLEIRRIAKPECGLETSNCDIKYEIKTTDQYNRSKTYRN